MARHRVCPWWLGYVLASPLRRWLSGDPDSMVAPYVREGMTVLEPGPGMGFFTLPMARRVGAGGWVVAVDVQRKMLDSLARRAAKAGLGDRIETRLARADNLGLADMAGQFDFALVFAVLHEMPDWGDFFRQMRQALKRGAVLLLAEPAGHVNETDFGRQLALAAEAGFVVQGRPAIRRSRAAVLRGAGSQPAAGS